MQATKRSLFDIGEDLITLERLIESVDGDISDPAVDEAITGWLKEFAKDQEVKCDGYVNLIRKWECEQAAAKAESERYSKSAAVRGNRIERLKFRLKEHMEATKQTRIETATGRVVAIQGNGGPLPVIIDAGVDPVKLDPEFQTVKTYLNNDAVRAALVTNRPLSFAHFGVRGTSLRIR